MKGLTLKFPKVHKALSTNNKNFSETNPRLTVIVRDERAIVLGDFMCLVVNLKDYFTLHENIGDADEIEELDKILAYMNGKTFNAKYWDELTKGAIVHVTDNDTLSIKTVNLEKELHYEDYETEILVPLEELMQAQQTELMPAPTIALNYKALRVLKDCFGTIMDRQSIVFGLGGQDRKCKFTFSRYKFIYGYIQADYGASQEAYMFSDLEIFTDSYGIELEKLQEAAKQNAVPPPPTTEEPAEEVSENQGNLFNAPMEVVKDKVPTPPEHVVHEMQTGPGMDEILKAQNEDEEEKAPIWQSGVTYRRNDLVTFPNGDIMTCNVDESFNNSQDFVKVIDSEESIPPPPATNAIGDFMEDDTPDFDDI